MCPFGDTSGITPVIERCDLEDSPVIVISIVINAWFQGGCLWVVCFCVWDDTSFWLYCYHIWNRATGLVL